MVLANTTLLSRVGNADGFMFRCELNDAFGLVLQGILAFTAFCILICKYMAMHCVHFDRD